MIDARIVLSGLYKATILTYLWGDVLRIFAGHVTPGEVLGKQASQGMWCLSFSATQLQAVMRQSPLWRKNGESNFNYR